MRHGHDGDRDAYHRSHLGRGHSGRVDNDLRVDCPALRLDASHPAACQRDSGYPRVRQDRRATLPRTRSQRPRQAARIEPAIGRQPGRAQHAIGVHQRKARPRLLGGNELHWQAVGLGPARLAPQFLEARRRRGQAQGADLAPTRVDIRLLRQLPVGGDAVHHHPGQCRTRSQLAHQARRMEGRTAGEVGSIEQHDIGPAQHGEVIRNRRSPHAAADDDRPRLGRHGAGGLRHSRPRPGPARTLDPPRCEGVARSARWRRPRSRRPAC